MLKKTAAFLLIISLLWGCAPRQTPVTPPSQTVVVDATPAARELLPQERYGLTAFSLGEGMTAQGLSCLSGDWFYFCASVSGETAESGLPETRLYRASAADGSLSQLAVYRTVFDAASESSTYVAAMFPGSAGDLWVAENTTYYIFDLPKNFVEAEDDRWDYYQYRGESTTLRHFLADGTEAGSFSLTNLQSTISAGVFSGEYICCAQGQTLLVLSREGRTVKTVTAPAWIASLAADENGTVYAFTDHEESSSRCFSLDAETWSFTEVCAMPAPLYSHSGFWDGAVYFTDRGNLFSWSAEQGGTKLLDWQDFDRERGAVTGLQRAGDGRVAALYQPSDAGSTLELLVLTPDESLPARQWDLTLGMLFYDALTAELVLNFNRSGAGQIRMADYSEYANLGQTGVAQLRIDLASGFGPDLLYSSHPEQPVTVLAENMLVDLSAWLEADTQLQEQGLMTSVFDALREEDGSLYTVAPSFLLSTCIGREDIVSPLPLTPGRTALICSDLESDGCAPVPIYRTRTAAMSSHLARLASFYETEDGWELEEDVLLPALTLLSLYPEALDWNAYAAAGINYEWARVRAGNQIYLSQTCAGFGSLAYAMSSVGDNAVLCGWPDVPGGHVLEIWECCGITKNCRDEALAWSFLRQYLLADNQISLVTAGFPTNREAFDRAGRIAMQGGAATFYPFGEEMVGISTTLTQAQYDAVLAAVDSARVRMGSVPGALADAVTAALADYFSGAAGEEDAMDAAQSAVNFYLHPEVMAMLP